MNKRIKKKRVLFEHINTLGIVLDRALVIIEEQAKEIIDLRKLVERNAQATNSELEVIKLETTKLGEQVGQLKSENLAMRSDFNKAVFEFKKAKKPFWKR